MRIFLPFRACKYLRSLHSIFVYSFIHTLCRFHELNGTHSNECEHTSQRRFR